MKTNDIRDRAFLIMNNLAFLVLKNSGKTFLGVYDLNNKENIATFLYNKSVEHFFISESTFPEGKRKYEMLFFVERNTKKIVEVLKNA